MPTPFFADLVRELCQEGGTGPLTPTGAVPGHRRFAGTVPPDTPFHYAVAGIAHTAQWEVGLGRIDASGRLVRDSVAASSNGGAPVDFAAGLKTIALTVTADWFATRNADIAALAVDIEAKQPLSTTHGDAETGANGDRVTVRRGTGWVNIPLSTLGFRNSDGFHALDGPLGAPGGSAAAPAVSFAADRDTGLFRAASDSIGFATGGAERLRLTSTGVAIGVATPDEKLHVAGSAKFNGPEFPRIILLRDGIAAWTIGGSGTPGDNSFNLRLNGSPPFLAIGTDGALRPGSDNSFAIGDASHRWSVVFSATGAINTSDAREKSWRGDPTAAEMAAARRIAGELGFFQWNDAVAVKGSESARLHFGVRAQAVWAIMADEGLIAPATAGQSPDCRYAFLCHDAWPEERDGDDQVVRPAGYRFGIRPDQLTLFLLAAQEARLAALEAAA
jgi:hypothetical protein